MTPTVKVVVDQAYQLGYDELGKIVRGAGGWLRSSGGAEGEKAMVLHDGTEYIFQGRGLTDFLYAVKDKNVTDLYAAIDLCEYIEKSAKQPPSVFVRDAILTRARELKAQIQATGDSGAEGGER